MNGQINQTNSTNLNKNFLIIVIAIAIIAVGAGGFILGKYSDNIPAKVAEIEEEKSEVVEKETGKCAFIQNISEKNQCWIDLAKEEKDENHCKKISADFPEARGDCYTELAILKDDSLICEKIDSSSLHKSCLEYFEGNDEKDETADWKTYENEKYGYEIKYQPSFKIDTSDQMKKITIGSPAVPYYTILIEESISSLKELKSLMQKRVEDLAPPNLKITWKDTTIADKKAIEMSYESFAGGTAIIHKTGVVKNTTAYIISSSSYTNNETEYYQILSTFKFIEADETANWKTYENEKYGFEMKYPEDFFTEQVLQPKTKVIQCDYANFVNNCPTKIITVNDIPFCLQKTDSAATGTVYTTYNYTAIKNKECFVVSFTVPYPNCSNFLPIESQEIQKAYDKCILDNEITKPKIINQMVSTFKFTD